MTEFRFGDRVKIISGFYEGCEGTLTSERVAKDARIILEVEITIVDATNLYREQIVEVYTNELIIIKKAYLK